MELFDKDHRYTALALEFDREVTGALTPIFEQWQLAHNASPRELAYIASMAVSDIHLELLLGKMYPIQKS